MPAPDAVTHTDEHPYELHAALVYCDLFGDRVTERICLRLKNELKAWWRCGLSCSGCYRRWQR
jgi:hypothetical protein